MSDDLVRQANEIVHEYGLTAEIFPDILTVGVKGDGRVYLPVLLLIGPFPGWEVINTLSTKLTNTLQISRVVYDLSRM